NTQTLARSLTRFSKLAYAELAVAVNAPSQLQPELVLLPDLAGVDRARVRDLFTVARACGAQHRLTKAEPLRIVRLVRMYVVALRAVTHRQHVVGEITGLVPRRRERDVTADLFLVGQHLDPRKPIRVRPHRVIDAREI